MSTQTSKPERKVALVAGAVKLGVLFVAPWVYLVVENYSIREKANGIKWFNLAWAVPVYYLASLGIATCLLAPSLTLSGLQSVSLDAVIRIAGFLPPYLVAILLGSSGFDVSVARGVAAGSLVLLGMAIGYPLNVSGTARYYRSLVNSDGGQIILPVSDIQERSGVSTNTVTFSRSNSILVLGQSGSGKTESIRLMINQLQSSDDEPFVVFDYKGEYEEEIFAEDETVVLSLRNSDVEWNLFEEVEDERDLREFGRMLYPDDESDGRNEFFEKGARQIFVAVTRAIYRDFDNPDNAHIREIFQNRSVKTLPSIFEDHPDLRGNIQEYLNEENMRTSQSVFAFVTQTIEDVFIEDFAAEGGEFSIREYMANPDGRKLILDIPQQNTQSVAPAFRFFIDQAIQLSLQDGDRSAYFVLDEFARVPSLDQIENLTGAGRAQGSQAILGLQGISQLRRHYDEDYANDMLAGVTQEILMRPADQQTTEYIQNRLGEEEYVTRRENPKKWHESDTFGNVQETYDTRYPIQSSDIQRFSDGEAVIMTTAGWQRAQLPMWHQLNTATRLGLQGKHIGPSDVVKSLGGGSPVTAETTAEVEVESAGGDDDDDDSGVTEQQKSGVAGGFHCPFCGQDLSQMDAVVYCPSCGEEVPAEVRSSN